MLKLLSILNFTALLTLGYLYSTLQNFPTHPVLALEQPATGGNCSAVGGNLAITAGAAVGGTGLTRSVALDLSFAEILITNPNDLGDVVAAIKKTDGRVIVRFGASKGTNAGMNADQFASLLTKAYQETQTPFVATAGRNEPNCAEFVPGLTDLTSETAFVSSVSSAIKASSANITLITGQLDYYCDPANVDGQKNSAVDYLNALAPFVDGVATPFYTGVVGGADATSKAFNNFAALITKLGKNIYITESGPSDYPKNGSQQEKVASFTEYATALQTPLTNNNVTALLLFNAFQLNPDPAFDYTQPFKSDNCVGTIRNQCADIDAIVTACVSQTVLEGDHSCKNICDGTPFNPCQFTPKSDCSIPYDAEEFTNPNVDETKKSNIAKYLNEYLTNAIVNTGFFFSFDATTLNPETCQNPENFPPAVRDLCQKEDSSNTTPGGGDQGKITILDPLIEFNSLTQTNTDPLLTKTQIFSGYYEQPTYSTPEGSGTNIRTTSDRQWWERQAAIQQLKATCFNLGMVINSIETEKFGPVRCMNYTKLTGCPECQAADLETEQDLFNLPELSSCVTLTSQSSPDEFNRCKEGFNTLNPALQTKIKQFPTTPIATFPIIEASAEVPAQRDNSSSGIVGTIIRIISNLLDLLRYQNPDLQTYYRSYPLTINDYQSVQVTSNALTPKTHLINTTTQSDAPNTLGFIPGRAFQKEHIPKELLFDPRFDLIQKFFNQNVSTCLEEATRSDRTTATNTINLKTQERQFDTGGFNAKLAETLDLTGTPDFEVLRFLDCSIFPSGLKKADDLGLQLQSIFTPKTTSGLEIINKLKNTLLEYTKGGKTSEGTLKPSQSCVDDPKTPEPDCSIIISNQQNLLSWKKSYQEQSSGLNQIQGTQNTITQYPEHISGINPLAGPAHEIARKLICPKGHPTCSQQDTYWEYLTKQQTTSPSGPGSTTSPTTKPPATCTPLNPSFESTPFRNPNDLPLDVDALISKIRQVNPGQFSANVLNQMEQRVRANYNTLVSRAQTAGYSPAFVMAIWIEETAAGFLSPYEFGCAINVESRRGFDSNLSCFLDLFDDYSLSGRFDSQLNLLACRAGSTPTFKEFLLIYSEGSCSSIQQNNSTFCNNPNFPTRIQNFYNTITP